MSGINSAGMDVRLLGIVPTPAVAYLTAKLEAAGGAMISASHNPVEDNGIKFFNGQGFKLDPELKQKWKTVSPRDKLARPVGKNIGRTYHCGEALQYYLSFLKNLFPEPAGIKIVIDCAHGALCEIAPKFYEELGAEVVSINSSPDGELINVNCGSTNPAMLKKTVLEEKADLGLAFDGDGDRLIAVDEQGQTVDGDVIMAVCAAYLKEKGRLRSSKLVATVMSNGGLK